MIGKQTIIDLVNHHAGESGLFVVDVNVSPSNNIRILVDSKKGVSLGECIELSKAVETSLNRDEEDFNLEVSSPGLSEPFKVLAQYEKNIGRDVEVVTNQGHKHAGKLIRTTENGFIIEELVKHKGEKKRPEIKTVETEFDYDLIHSTKVVVSYK